MKKLILNVFLFIALLSVSGSAYALDFIKFGTSHDVDFWGTPNVYFAPFPSTVEYLAARGKNQIASVDLEDQNVQDAFNGDFGSFEAVVVSENIDEISPESYALFNQFVSAGGCLILTGDHGEGEDEFLNNTFGYSVGITTTSEDPADTFSIQPGAAGTAFPGGPASLASADLTAAFSNTPGSVIYNGAIGVGVFTDGFGGGTVIAIGWDYCCTDGPGTNTEGQILDWYEVVNRAFDECTGSTGSFSRPIPTLSEWGLIAMAGILGIFGLFAALRRRKVTA
ncbi:MAG: IPTL-CTERM sorting domain-containing protein [Thermodesulfobacteriota bacterium]